VPLFRVSRRTPAAPTHVGARARTGRGLDLGLVSSRFCPRDYYVGAGSHWSRTRSGPCPRDFVLEIQDCGRARTGRGLDLGHFVLEISSSRFRIAGGLALVADSIWALSTRFCLSSRYRIAGGLALVADSIWAVSVGGRLHVFVHVCLPVRRGDGSDVSGARRRRQTKPNRP
jgi:hypothetical protein